MTHLFGAHFKRQSARLHFGAVSARHYRGAEELLYTQMFQNSVCSERGLRCIYAQKPTAFSERLERLHNARIERHELGRMLAVMRHEDAPEIVNLSGALGDGVGEQVTRAKADMDYDFFFRPLGET